MGQAKQRSPLGTFSLTGPAQSQGAVICIDSLASCMNWVHHGGRQPGVLSRQPNWSRFLFLTVHEISQRASGFGSKIVKI